MKYHINLLPQKKQTTIDTITYFALHYLRYILVITQLVAIGVFFYRFKVDQDIVDLKDILTQKRAIVQNTQELLDSVKTLDSKIGNVKGLYTKQEYLENEYVYFMAKIPPSIHITSLHMDKTTLTLNGEVLDIESVKTFYDELRQEKLFKSVALSNVNKSDGGFTFQLTLTEFINPNGP